MNFAAMEAAKQPLIIETCVLCQWGSSETCKRRVKLQKRISTRLWRRVDVDGQ